MSFLTMSRGVIFLVLSLAANRGLAAVDEIIRPKVVVVTMFEPGQDTGDAPGELQYWVEREQLTRVLPLPAAYHDVRSNADGSVIGIVTGVGNSNAAASIMALGLDPRFDLRKSYWLVAGIAGIDPVRIGTRPTSSKGTSTMIATGTSNATPKARNMVSTNDKYCSISGAGVMLAGANPAMKENNCPNTK